MKWKLIVMECGKTRNVRFGIAKFVLTGGTMPKGQKSPNIMVCSHCGTIIAAKESDETLLDIFDCSWPCPNPDCEQLWLSSDG